MIKKQMNMEYSKYIIFNFSNLIKYKYESKSKDLNKIYVRSLFEVILVLVVSCLFFPF